MYNKLVITKASLKYPTGASPAVNTSGRIIADVESWTDAESDAELRVDAEL